MAEEPQHWPTERMINEGHADYATEADLEALPNDVLAEIAQICAVDQFAPDECIPCLAHTTYLERVKQAVEAMAPDLPSETEHEIPPEDKADEWLTDPEQQDDQNLADWEEESQEGVPVDIRRKAPVEVLQFQMELMRNTLDEIVNGPPIPPKEVSLDELALLTVAAQKWIAIMEAQGVELSPGQKAVFDTTKELVARLHHD